MKKFNVWAWDGCGRYGAFYVWAHDAYEVAEIARSIGLRVCDIQWTGKERRDEDGTEGAIQERQL